MLGDSSGCLLAVLDSAGHELSRCLANFGHVAILKGEHWFRTKCEQLTNPLFLVKLVHCIDHKQSKMKR